MNELEIDAKSGLFYRPGASADLGIIGEVRRYHHDWPVRPGDVVIDLGAHIGAATIRALELGAALVVAVEPSHANFQVLLANVVGKLVVPIEAAAALQDGVTTLYENSGGPQYGHSTVTKGRKVATRVAAVSLVGLLDRYQPQVLKCDIEYGEYELEPVLRALPTHVRVLAMEVHLSGNARPRGLALIASIEAQGFRAVSPYHVSEKAWHVNICWERA